MFCEKGSSRFRASFCGINRNFALRRIILRRNRISGLIGRFITNNVAIRGIFLFDLLHFGLLFCVARLIFFNDQSFFILLSFLYFLRFIAARDRRNSFEFCQCRFFHADHFNVTRCLLSRTIITVRCRIRRIKRFAVRARTQLSTNRIFRATRMFNLYSSGQHVIFTRYIYFCIRFYFLCLQRLSLRRETRRFLFIIQGFFALLIFLRGRTICSITVRANRIALFRLLFRRISRQCIRLTIRRRCIMTFILNHVSMDMLFIRIINVRMGRTTILINLVVLSRYLMFFRDMVLIIYVLRRDGLKDLFVRVFLDRRAMISRGLRIIPFLFGFLAIILRSELWTIKCLLHSMDEGLLRIQVTLRMEA